MTRVDKTFARRIAVAAGREKADLVIKNGRIIDVFNGEIIEDDLAIVDGFIAGIGRYKGKEELDAKKSYISPGLIDGHVHVESSMVTPQEFAKVLLKQGVTTAITDPHEIANVSGIDGIKYILDSSENTILDLFVMLPSCVPATEFEYAGAKLSMEDLQPFLHHPRVLGLAEVMNFPAVKYGERQMLEKLSQTSSLGKIIDGHAAGLQPDDLNIYMAAGIRTDHECTTLAEAKARLQKGMYLMIREGTVAKDLKNIIGIVNEKNARRCLFVTDDKHLDDLIDEGSIDFNIKLAIQCGLNPITAIQMATLNAAECFGLRDRGAIAPGYKADLLLIDNLTEMNIQRVFKDGLEIVQNGVLKNSVGASKSTSTPHLTQSVRFLNLLLDDLDITVTGKYANIIEVIPNSLVTRHCIEEVDVNHDNLFQTSVGNDLLKLAVIERHNMTGQIGLGIVKGLGLKSGAIASTVSHDSHNLILCGENDEDMLLAASELNKRQGGLIVVNNGAILASLDLPISGLLSPLPYQVVYTKLQKVNDALKELGVSVGFNPFLTLSFLALPVIPELKLTVQGLFHVGKFQHLPTALPKLMTDGKIL
ncbi:adenine deaminase [Mesobacillus maritimus]|uniref:Adenine deaminase n=1 Tax=Mesobacillus maritimus TaxID=1643336 RepID=A0ABS7K196_9BACI|nr:adenine deaminase [Mesobacillus maritimus]MBY0096025.1 adenine deaminase [Mesobacillus maritimus]